ncbi:alpha/beta fold hydrolase [Actinomadura macra]|uniref:alpha/beta fold hydrolase n=1 Tax=Actinomadura macra TaxID=46164 RepID=UPI000B15F0E2|nr:alpha/beta hydrolase [Actinomadura macra]
MTVHALLGGPTTGRTLDVDGARVHYHDVGDGPALIMLQAFGPLPGTTAWLTYHRIVDDLAAAHRCILIDYPNFGRSEPTVFNEPVHDLYARNTFAVMDALGIPSAPVMGVSTGGTVALTMALIAPERVRALVIGSCEASTGGDPYLLAPFPSEVHRLFEDCQSNPPDPDRIRRLLTAIVHDPALVTDELVTAMHDLRVSEPEHALAWSRSRSVPHTNLAALTTLADVPTLVLHGRHDRMVPLEQALRLLSHLPSADLVVLNECGHWPTVERPNTYVKQALTFLNTLPLH